MVIMDGPAILIEVVTKNVGHVLGQSNGTLTAKLVLQGGTGLRSVPKFEIRIFIEIDIANVEGTKPTLAGTGQPGEFE
jgi:hypothetical protein